MYVISMCYLCYVSMQENAIYTCCTNLVDLKSHAFLNKIVGKTKSHTAHNHTCILSVILLMKNNILRAYISIEMATFQKKVNHALSPEEAKKDFSGMLSIARLNFSMASDGWGLRGHDQYGHNFSLKSCPLWTLLTGFI